MKIEVMPADSHPVVRCGLRRMMEDMPDLVVAGETGHGNVAFDLLRSRECTVSTQRTHILGKLKLHGQVDRVRHAIEHKLLDPTLE